MRTLLMGKRVIQKQDINYYLLAEEYGDLGECYGVKIACSNGEDDSIRGITLSQSKILLLLSVLMEQSVTPTTLHDVVEDWILI